MNKTTEAFLLKYSNWLLLAVGAVTFAGFVFFTEREWRQESVLQAGRHAQAIAPAVWNFEEGLSADYMELAALVDGYERIEVRTIEDEVFYVVRGPKIQGWSRVWERLGLLPRLRIELPIVHENELIGRLEVVAVSDTIRIQLLALVGLILGVFLVERSVRVVEGKRTLEERVRERTEQLAQGEAELRQLVRLLDLSPNIIFVRESNGEITYFNKGALVMGDADLVKGQLEKLYQATLARDTQGVLTRARIWEGDVELVQEGSAKLILSASVALSQPDQDRAQRVLFIGTDIGERRELEARLLQVQRTQAVGTLASGIAHDFNNLLTPILLSVQLLQLSSKENPVAVKSLETVAQCARRGSDLVRQLLNISGNRQAERTAVYLPSLLDDVRTLLKSTFPKGLEMEFDWPSDLPIFEADPTNLHQAILNLCLNARDAMSRGGTLRLNARKVGRPSAGHDDTVDWVEILVTDTGVGISKDMLGRVFDPFFSTKDSSEGTGLGLSTVQGIVHGHQGLVEVESEVGKGSQFRILLPMVNAEAKVLPLENLARSTVAKGELVLVVDDEAMILESTAELLRLIGFRVMTAQSGAAALQLQREHPEPFRVLITDLMMPKMDGIELVEAFRVKQPDVPVIMVSGLLNPPNRARIAASRISRVLGKPFKLNDLRGALSEVLKESKD